MEIDYNLVSIIMPVKNAAPWLADCLDSIIRQSFTNWELTVVDDHSEDATFDMLKVYADKDNRIRCFGNQGNGIVDALNQAMKAANGEWISRMDADDIMPKYKLKKLVAALQNRKDCIATGKVKYFSEGNISEGYQRYEQWLNKRVTNEDHWVWAYRECVISSANWLTHRQNVHFAAGVYPEDYALTFYWYRKNLSIVVVNEVTHWWREHDQRTSRNSKNYQQRAFFALKILEFLKIDHDSSRTLVIMGKNQKSKLVAQVLRKKRIAFEYIGLENLEKMRFLERPQVLLTVFPKKEERIALEQLLGSTQLTMGRDWWWL